MHIVIQIAILGVFGEQFLGQKFLNMDPIVLGEPSVEALMKSCMFLFLKVKETP